MKLKQATLLVIVGIAATFVLRTLGTILPEMFKSLAVVQVGIGVHLFTKVALATFFLTVRRSRVGEDRPRLQRACAVAAAGAAAGLLVEIKNIFIVLDLPFPLLLMHPVFEAVLPAVGSATALVFFIAFRKDLTREERPRIGTATQGAIAGLMLLFLLQSIVLTNYLYSGELLWLANASRQVAIGVVPLFAFAAGAILYFFLTFRRFVEASGRN